MIRTTRHARTTAAGLAAALALATGVTTPAAAQSDPAGFDTVINIPEDQPSISGSIGSDTQLNLSDGGSIGGSIGSSFDAGPIDGTGSNIEVNVSGGSVSSGFDAFSGSTVNISGGTVGSDFDAASGSTVNLSGGSVGDFFQAFSGSTVNLSGGTVGDVFTASSGSTVNLFGTSFFLDGVELTGLVFDEPFIITDRGDVTLTGLLADGSAFDFDLNSSPVSGEDFFGAGATLTVTLVPEPSSLALLALGGLALAARRRRPNG